MLSTVPRELVSFRTALALVAVALLTGCVYRVDVQQGNLLEESAIEQVQVGMTRSQVQFLLGTPMVADPFRRDRWDYPYYFRQGRSRNVAQRWLVVRFEDDRVAHVETRLHVEGPAPEFEVVTPRDLEEGPEPELDMAGTGP